MAASGAWGQGPKLSHFSWGMLAGALEPSEPSVFCVKQLMIRSATVWPRANRDL